MSLEKFPVKYITSVLLDDGTPVVFRPIHPSDANKAAAFRASLTDDSIKARFLGFIPSVTEQLVQQLVQVDFTKEMAIVAEITVATKKVVLGVGRIAKDEDDDDIVELAVIVIDEYQGKNLGAQLVDYMIYIAKNMGYKHMTAVTSSYNEPVLKLLKSKNINKQFTQNGNLNLKINL